MADLFVFAGTNWENPVPESDTKIITVKLGPYRVSDIRDFYVFFVSKSNPFFFFFFFFFLTFILHILYKTKCIASSPIDIAYVHIMFRQIVGKV